MPDNAQLEQSRVKQEKRNQRQAAALSGGLFFLLVLLCFCLTAFTKQEPPPGEQFVAVGFADLGSAEVAGGDVDTQAPSEVIQEAVEESVSSSEANVQEAAEEVVTQTNSEVSVNSDPDPVPDPKPDPVPVDRTAQLFQNLSASNAGGGGSQGSSEGVGNEGVESGSIEGRGVVTGDFGEGLVGGGSMIGEPKLAERPIQAGTVRMRLQVGPDGKVLSAKPEFASKLTTLTDTYHLKLAERAAFTAVFESDSDQSRRLAYITIRFDLE